MRFLRTGVWQGNSHYSTQSSQLNPQLSQLNLSCCATDVTTLKVLELSCNGGLMARPWRVAGASLRRIRGSFDVSPAPPVAAVEAAEVAVELA